MNRSLVILRHAIVADDNHAIRQSMIALLMTVFMHARISEAQNGHQVLDLVASDPPDLIIMDAEMPQLNGLDTAREIKVRCPVARVIILILEPHHHSLALQAGADACVLKGIRSEELLHVIAQLGFEVASVWPFGHRSSQAFQ